ncbi:MAG: ABC transporter ATP-binding protein [Eubacteriaceae bacterium]|jgi:peptide/nickel transport system ATP-binding protein|nr:ABC transporter ATP-binding protein [Eubacteriaceae bacterium]
MKEMNPIISIKDLSLAYKKEKEITQIFEDFHLDIYPGEKIVLLGESGSGKSTLARVLTGLLPPSARISSGDLVLQDIHLDLNKKFMHWNKIRGKRISMIFQDAMEALNPVITVYDHFKDLLLHHKIVPEKEVRSFAKKILKQLRFEDPEHILESYSFELSGGMCQRICIALCVSLEPEIIIADEPTSALDIINQMEVLKALKSLEGQTVFMITHDISSASMLADRIIILQKGVICESGSRREIIGHPQDPYTRKLIDAYAAVENIQRRKNPEHGEVILQVKDLQKTYGRHKKVLDNLYFSLRKGEVFGILGESGCGKSTLSRCILGLEPVGHGEIMYRDANLLNLNTKARRQLSPQIQMVFQEARGCLHPNYPILKIVQEPLVYNKLYDPSTREQMAKEMLERVGIAEELYERRPPQLSTGQCQRVGIARALITKPEILICDEPISALDVPLQLQILDLLMQLKKEFDLTVILISHDFRVLKNISDTIGVMYEGRFVEITTNPSELINSQNPYVQKLVQASHNAFAELQKNAQ